MFHMQAEVVPFGFSGEGPVKRIALWTTTVLVLAVTVAGFAPGSTPYSTPYDLPFVERPSNEDAGAFDGLLTLAETLPPSSTLNVLWMHGMCTHRSDWIEERLGKLAAALGSDAQDSERASCRTPRRLVAHRADCGPLRDDRRDVLELVADHHAFQGGIEL